MTLGTRENRKRSPSGGQRQCGDALNSRPLGTDPDSDGSERVASPGAQWEARDGRGNMRTVRGGHRRGPEAPPGVKRVEEEA